MMNVPVIWCGGELIETLHSSSKLPPLELAFWFLLNHDKDFIKALIVTEELPGPCHMQVCSLKRLFGRSSTFRRPTTEPVEDYIGRTISGNT
jgi:hypothetical protein